MAKPDKILEQLQDLIQERIDQFNGNLPAVQQSAFNAILDLTSELEVGSDRRIKPSIKNVKLIAKIKQELQKIIGKTDFEASLDDLVKTYDDITRLQNSYFTSLIGKFKVPKVLDEIRNLSIEATKDAFSEDALAVNVIDPIRDILVKNITQGGSRDEFLQEVRAYILGKEGEEEGRLLKYSKTYTTTALNQYSRNYGSTLSDDLGFQWYQYMGTNKDTTRPFCLKLTEAKKNGCMEYIHKSQFEDLVKGIICGEQVPIYEKYNLPQGMIEGTNASNLRVNAGGWNCNHDFAGVPDVLVPQKYKDQLASGTLGGTPEQKQEAVQVATETKIEKLVQQRDKIEEQITKLEEQPVQPVAEDYKDVQVEVDAWVENVGGKSVKDIIPKDLMNLIGLPKDINGKFKIWHRSEDESTLTFDGSGVTIQRIINWNRKQIENAYFKINDDSKYKGQGSIIFYDQVNEAIKQGWKEIVTHAARKGGYNGYYTWARLGYEPRDSMFKIEDHIKNTIKEFNLTYNTDVDNFTELLSIKEGQEWWKKNGQDFVGYFILDENSNSYITLKNYMEERYGK